ncbi:MAG TPA: three-Cys-motif partner protein TcmP [Pyrinomonadaceae bacterium]|nr:three-Cys-motif partner protein TcmP [Pyrinomonadaceae bacterium]
MGAVKEFFAVRSARSEVKTEIVRKYFSAWARIMINQVRKKGGDKIGYADLFSGRGRYEDGSKSTPLLILEGAIRDNKIRDMLVCLFNDEDKENADALVVEIGRLDGVKFLRYQPVVDNRKIDDRLAEHLEKISTIPTLYFLDPFGYNGLSLRLIKAVLRPYGCDCIFFFNYARVNAALSNPAMRTNMDLFFGKERADRLRSNLAGKTPAERESLIISELKMALRELGGRYVVEYFFKDNSGRRTSYFLILASKVALAEKIMKEIMANESSHDDHGFASFGFNPRDRNPPSGQLEIPGLFTPPDPREELATMLLGTYQGKTMRVIEVYQRHNIGRPYTMRNYKDAILKLEAEGRIKTAPSAEKRLRADTITLGDNVLATFPAERIPNGH